MAYGQEKGLGALFADEDWTQNPKTPDMATSDRFFLKSEDPGHGHERPILSEDPVHCHVTSFNSRHLAIAIAVSLHIAAHTGRCLHAIAACPNLIAAVKQLYTQPLSPLGAKLDTYPLRVHMRRVSPPDFFLLQSLRWGPSWGHKEGVRIDLVSV